VVTKPVRQSALFGLLMRPPAPAPTVTDLRHGEQPTPEAKSHEHHLRILIAEDNPVNQKLLGIQLRKLGYTADLAQDGKEVLAALKTTGYDVILMDCQMPEMDGYEVTRKIRANQDLPFQPWIIAMTANAMQGDREKCLLAGMDEYLAKPINLPALKVLLDNKPAHS
jgi:CheY-like chemotaxis protein